jgi:hypothetical protein
MKIKPMIGEYEVPGIQRIGVVERRQLVPIEVPGLAGDYHQDLGMAAARIIIEGTLAGDEARDGFLEAVREKLAGGEPVDFVADIVSATEIEQVLIADLQVDEIAGSADTFRYAVTLAQYVEPPPPPADPALEDALGQEAEELFDISKLPEMLSAPDFGNPVPPLSGTLDGARAALQSLSGVGPQLAELFGST